MTWVIEYDRDAFERASNASQQEMAEAATAAMRAAGEQVKRIGRANISREGFGQRWQNALRLKVYPETGSSLKPAAWIYHKIPYVGVFEEPTAIQGPLWLRLRNAPAREGGAALTPKRIEARFGAILRPIRLGAKTYLAVRLRLPAGTDPGQVSVTTTMLRGALRRGESGGGGQPGRGRLMTIPLFHRVDSVQLRKRFDIAGAAQMGRDALPALYIDNFKGD
ncbi:MAG: hypothetical protein K2Y29_00410 [Beijerinckiaceae bacterium]|nr:hypothetical protein [Beijerinckiaceae bacterium]